MPFCLDLIYIVSDYMPMYYFKQTIVVEKDFYMKASETYVHRSNTVK